MSNSLFHYTDVGAIKSILENRELWLTDIRFLNDSEELRDGVAYVLDALRKERIGDPVHAHHFDGAIKYLTHGFDEHVSYYIDEEPTYVCSFSESGNQLSQWRAYGSYAIEFHRERLDEELFIYDCIYDRKSKIEIAEEMVARAIDDVSGEFYRADGEPGPDALMALSGLIRTASIFKNESFYEEKEVRCSIDMTLPNKNLRFRQRNGVLVPYTTIGFSLECIKAIHIGPMRDQELAFISMSSLVAYVLHCHTVDGGGIEHEIDVVMSDIPYRAP